MDIQAIQANTPVVQSTTENKAETTSGFSSYLQTSASLEDIFYEASRVHNVPMDLLKAIAKAESNFRPDATSRSGAQGIMQLMPKTAQSLGVSDSFDPYQNIMGGAKYISDMLKRYDGNVTFALAAYNAGPNNVSKYGGVPPFKETQDYVVKVQRFMNEGINLPDASYLIAGQQKAPAAPPAPPTNVVPAPAVASIEQEPAATPPANLAAASAESTLASESYVKSLLDEIFSYNDYLRFLEIFLRIQEEQQRKEMSQKENRGISSMLSHRDLMYSPAVLSLIEKGPRL